MTEPAFVLDDEDDFDDRDPGAYLRMSRDATVEDLAELLPDKTADERAQWLADRQAEGTSVTIAVVTEVPSVSVRAFGETVPVREITGIIMGPPGSENYLRRPAKLADVNTSSDEYHQAGVYCGEPSHCTEPHPGALPGTPYARTTEGGQPPRTTEAPR